MNIKIILGKNGNEDTVVLTDRSRVNWSAWLARTEQAVKAVRAAFDENKITPAAIEGRRWLELCGVRGRKEFEDLERHLPQLGMPMGAANGRRCKKCGSKIWGKMALITGLGSECRRGGGKANKAVRELRTRFQTAQAGLRMAA